jgi:hypothetical protein
VSGGAITVNTGGLTLVDTTSRNGAHITVNSGSSLFNTGILRNQTDAQFANNGTMVARAGSVLNNTATLTNTGTFDVERGGAVNGSGFFIQNTGGITTVNGSLQQSIINIQDGILKGDGSITGAVTIGTDAVLSPGNSPGTLTINGNLALDGTLAIEIAGVNPGSFDVLDVHGLVDFGRDSLIALDLSQLSNIAFDTAWDFLFSDAAFSGLNQVAYAFQGLQSGWNYRIDEVSIGGRYALELHLATVPEPGSLALFGLGLAGVMGWSAKRKSLADRTCG